MKKLLIALATTVALVAPAHVEESRWRLHRTCSIISSDPDITVNNVTTLTLEDALVIQKFIPDLRKCDAFQRCVADRNAGKVKQCYENDRRWR